MSKLNILGGFYQVRVHGTPIIHNGKEVDGLCCPHDKTIDVALNADSEVIDYNLIHEVTHGFVFEGGLYQVIPKKIIEIICEQNAKTITTNFKLIPKKNF